MKTNARMQHFERAYLFKVFELTEQIDRNGVPLAELEDTLGLAESEGAKILESLVGAGMIVWPSKGMVMLTERGLTSLSKEREDMYRAEESHRPRTPRTRGGRVGMTYAGTSTQPQAG